MKNITLPIVIETDADGFFVSCPVLQGCYSQGDTYEEAVENNSACIARGEMDRRGASSFGLLLDAPGLGHFSAYSH